MRPTLTWHPGETEPHVTQPPAVDDELRVIPADWERYVADIRAVGECPHAPGPPRG